MTDLRYAIRTLRRTPGLTAAAVVALALGIGANSAIFSVVYAALLRPLPIRDAARVAAIHAYNPKMNIPPIAPSYNVYGVWREQARSFESMAASAAGVAELENEKVAHWRVSASFFPTLGIQPAVGRAFTDAEDQPGGPNLAIVSDDLWSRRFGRDPRVVGQTLSINSQMYSIVGVMPRGFDLDGKPAQVYTAIRLNPKDKTYVPVTAYGRLRAGVSMAQAQGEIDAIEAARGRSGWKAKVWSLRESLVRDLRTSLLILLGAVGMVLLIACANVASLLLARSSARRHEVAVRVAVRVALGAPRRRLVRQFFTESMVVGAAGAAAGLLLAALAMRLVPALDHERLPSILLATRIDRGVLAFTAAVAMLTSLLFGVFPALSAAPARAQDRGADTRRGKRVWNALVVSETAIALVVLIGAALLIRSFLYLRDTAPGFRTDGLSAIPLKPAKGQAPIPFYDEALRKARATPGVGMATLASALPLDGDYRAMGMRIEGHQFARPEDVPVLWHRLVEPEYFRALAIPLRRGRTFAAGEREAVIVNETMARRFWPGQDAIGKHVGRFTIVGVAADVRIHDVTNASLLEVYFPYTLDPQPSMTLAVRGSRTAAAAVARLLGAPKVWDMREVAGGRLIQKSVVAALAGVFAALAFALAIVGIYGVLSFTVARRTHEIGVRLALGADRRAVIRMVAREAATLAGIGIAIGLAGALASSRAFSAVVYGSGPIDPAVYAAASAALAATAVVAAWVPARRAAAIDPSVALRQE